MEYVAGIYVMRKIVKRDISVLFHRKKKKSQKINKILGAEHSVKIKDRIWSYADEAASCREHKRSSDNAIKMLERSVESTS